MNKLPRVSIGLPVYNGEKFLTESLDSILGQTFQDFELIISDNASTDGTQTICEVHAAKDQRIRYYRNEKNRGAAWNYNRVFELSKGIYFKWAAHDDVCAPTFLERCVHILDQNPSVVLCYPRTLIIDEQSNIITKYNDGPILSSPNPCKRFKQALIHPPGRCNRLCGIIRSSILGKTPLIGNYNGSDYILLAQLALLGEFHEIPEDLFFRRDHPGMSGRAHPSPTEFAAWLDPSKTKNIVLPEWRKGREYVMSILRAELNTFSRVSCLIYMLLWMAARRKLILKELLQTIKQSVVRT